MKDITITQDALDNIMEEANASKWENLETGGFLFGYTTGSERTILHATGPGSDATRTPVFFEPGYSSSAIEFVKLNTSGKLKYTGFWHLHCVDGLSGGDVDTLKGLDKDYPGFLSLVVNSNTMEVRVFCFQDNELVELELNVVKEDSKTLNFSRTLELADPEFLKSRNLAVIGAGSGGSTSSHYLGKTGIGTFTLIDHEVLEPVNIVRHVGNLSDIGSYKVDVMGSALKKINPDVHLTLIKKKLALETRNEFQEIIRNSHATLACSGNILANQLINEICLKLGKPSIYAGAYPKALGGFVFIYTGNENAPCFNCVFGHVGAVDDTNEEQEKTAKRYGFTREELANEQGFYIDISFIALLQAKLALLTLLEEGKNDYAPLPGNFVSWDSKTLKTQWANIQKREDCAICSPDGFYDSFEKREQVPIDAIKIPN